MRLDFGFTTKEETESDNDDLNYKWGYALKALIHGLLAPVRF